MHPGITPTRVTTDENHWEEINFADGGYIRKKRFVNRYTLITASDGEKGGVQVHDSERATSEAIIAVYGPVEVEKLGELVLFAEELMKLVDY